MPLKKVRFGSKAKAIYTSQFIIKPHVHNVLLYRFKLELLDGMISSSLSMDACVGDVCTGRIVLLDESISPLPQCYSNGSISWIKLPGKIHKSFFKT